MEYTVWPDSSDPQNSGQSQGATFFEDEESFNLGFDNELNMLDYQNSPLGLPAEQTGLSSSHTVRAESRNSNLNEQWSNELTHVGNSSTELNDSLARDPMDPAANAPYDDIAHDGVDHKQSFEDQPQNGRQYPQASQHRRGASEALSMRIPLVEHSHLDSPTMKSMAFQNNTDLYGGDLSGLNTQMNSPEQNVYNTPMRVPPGGVGAGHRLSPTLSRDSPSYNQKGLESPMEYGTFDSPYLSYQPFPVVPYHPSQVGKQTQGRRRMSGATRGRRTSSSASQSSITSVSTTQFDPLDQPTTPLARGAGKSTLSAHTTPRADSMNESLDWQTPKTERGWQTPSAVDTPLARTPSINQTPSATTPLTTPTQEATPLQNTPAQCTRSPSQTNTPSNTGKRDGRRRIGRKQIEILEDFFHKNPHPERADRINLAAATSLEQRTVQIWFQNRRAKTRAMKMPPSRADQSEEANQYRAAAAAASNAAATALNNRNSPAKKVKGVAQGLEPLETGSPTAQRSGARITSPLNKGTTAARGGGAQNRGNPPRPIVTRSRSATNTNSHRYTSSVPNITEDEAASDQAFWQSQLSQNDGLGLNMMPPSSAPQFQRASSLGNIPRPASMGNLGPVPEDMRNYQSRNMASWQMPSVSPGGPNNTGAAGQNLGYHQQLPNVPAQQVPQSAQQNQMIFQRMQQLQRLQYLKQLKHKTQLQQMPPYSAGAPGTRGRSSSMYEPIHFSGMNGELDMDMDFLSGSNPGRSDSVASLCSNNSAKPPSPLLDQQNRISPDLRSMQNSPDLVSPWGNSQGNLFSGDWAQPGFNIEGDAPNWNATFEDNEHQYISGDPIQEFGQQSNVSGSSAPKFSGNNSSRATGGWVGSSAAASAAAAALKSSQRRNTAQPPSRSRQPSIRLQLDEHNNAAQLVVVSAESDSGLPRFSDETDWVHGHLTQTGQSNSPGRAEREAKRLIGERVSGMANENKN